MFIQRQKLESKDIVVSSTYFGSRSARIHVHVKWQIVKWRKLELKRFEMENSHVSGSTVRYCSPQLLNRFAVDEYEWKTMMSIRE